jgi:hypothetical protein
MTPRNTLTAERVRALLDCNPEAGNPDLALASWQSVLQRSVGWQAGGLD